ncbi:MAG TPA: DUF1801 domain-containing protein [Bryobacteraceae bacterium]|nr:DUF1801 domain-containing protein [Bryobacteraceae bacterium]
MPGTGIRKPHPTLLQFLKPYDSGISKLALALREVVLEEAPGAGEIVYNGYCFSLGFTFSGRLKESFCYVAAFRDHVNLGLNRGAALYDPEKVLKGTGKIMRHLGVHDREQLNDPRLRHFIRLAIEDSEAFYRVTELQSKGGVSIVESAQGKERRSRIKSK